MAADVPDGSDAAEAAAPPAAAPLAAGQEVEIVGTPMNGSVGELEEYLAEKERWKVRFASGVAKNFKAENLRVAAKLAARRPSKPPRRQLAPAEAPKPAAAGEPKLLTGTIAETVLQLKRESSIQASELPRIAEAARAARQTAPAAGTDGSGTAAVEAGAAPQTRKKKRPRASAAAAAEEAEVAAEHGAEATPAAPAAVSGTSGADGAVNLAGRSFPGKAALIDHVRTLQAKLEAAGGSGVLAGGLEGEDLYFLLHLVLQHPKTAEKLRLPVRGFRYGVHPSFPKSKCFIIVFKDGTEEPVSAMKCVKELFGLSTGGAKKHNEPQPSAEPGSKRPRTGPHEVSRAEAGLKLIREDAVAAGAAHADRWEYPLMDEVRRCFVGYLKRPLEEDLLKSFYKKVREGTKWCRPLDSRGEEAIPIPRKTAWMVAKGYSKYTYRYGGVDVEPQEFPPWMEEIMEAYMPLCGLTAREQWPNSCNLNLYENGDMSVGWHGDNEKLFEGKKRDIQIISVSLGQARSFELRLLEGDDANRPLCRLLLENGDLCTMEGMTQKYYQHRVPKEDAAGPRINLTWRWIRLPADDGQAPKAAAAAKAAPAASAAEAEAEAEAA